MTSILLMCVASAMFFVALARLGVVDLSRNVLSGGKAALGILSNAELDDVAKEAAIQRMSGWMFCQFALISFWSCVALTVPAALLAAAIAFGWTDLQVLERTALSGPFIALNLVAIGVVVYWRWRA